MENKNGLSTKLPDGFTKGLKKQGNGGKALLRRTGFQIAGLRSVDIFEDVDVETEATETHIPIAPTPVDFQALIREAQQGDLEPPNVSDTRRPRNPTVYDPTLPGTTGIEEYDPANPQGYNPSNPLLSLDKLLNDLKQAQAGINATNKNHSATDRYTPSTPTFRYNPHLLSHIISGAPYTSSLCRKCTRTRSCPAYRQVLELQTSVSQCAHVRMNLYWRATDPDNRGGSWKFEIKDYTRNDARWEGDHVSCVVRRPEERVELLAMRVVEDLKEEVMRGAGKGARFYGSEKGLGQRGGNLRMIRDEVFALLGAWESAKLKRLELVARRERAEERKRVEAKRVQDRLEEMLCAIQVQKDIEQQKTAEVVQTPPPTTLKPTPEPTTTSEPTATPEPQETIQPTTSEPKETPRIEITSPPTTPQSAKRKRSARSPSPSPSSPSSPASSVRSTKRVRFTSEVEALEEVERPRLASLPIDVETGEIETEEAVEVKEVETEIVETEVVDAEQVEEVETDEVETEVVETEVVETGVVETEVVETEEVQTEEVQTEQVEEVTQVAEVKHAAESANTKQHAQRDEDEVDFSDGDISEEEE
jgi:hypothetical protein